MPVTDAAASQAVERVENICREHGDSRGLRLALLEGIRRVISFDAYSWLLTDPETEVGSAPLADVPCLPELPRLIRLKYLTALNRWTRLAKPVAFLQAETGNRPERSLVWRELLRHYAVADVASLVFRDRFGCWAFLELWRNEPNGPFTESEGEFLTAITTPITAALRRCQAHTFQTLGSGSSSPGPVVLVLSEQLEVRAQTAQTESFLRILVPPDGDRRPIPSGAYNVAAQLLAAEAGVDGHPPRARVHLAGGTWLTLQAARMGQAGSSPERDIAVTIEATSPTDRMTLFIKACGLSARESELVQHLAKGADTRQIAELMFLSQHTVQDHLKSIFAKTHMRNRRDLLTYALGR